MIMKTAYVPNYEGIYLMYENGSIYNEKFKRFLKPIKQRHGYLHIMLSKNNIKKQFSMHRLMWLSFNGDIPHKMVINHLDNNKENNNLSNLQLCTYEMNHVHCYSQGRHPTAKNLDKKTVLDIFNDKRSRVKIAKSYGLGTTVIQHIKEKRTYKRFFQEEKINGQP